MLSLKFIRIRTERPIEERLASIWFSACSEFGIPCILIYLKKDTAYISANLKHLQHSPGFEETGKKVPEIFLELQQKFTRSIKGYWQHNDCFYTFDLIPKPVAREAAAEIFEILSGFLQPEFVQLTGIKAPESPKQTCI